MISSGHHEQVRGLPFIQFLRNANQKALSKKFLYKKFTTPFSVSSILEMICCNFNIIHP